MREVILLGIRLLEFLRDEILPWLTTVPDSIDIPLYSPITGSWFDLSIPWLFGVTPLEYFLISGLLSILAVRIVKFFLDAFGL
jgi:hypothetical protein